MKYFGTDGIRDKANTFTSDFLAKIVRGLINYAGDNIKVMLGGDTRESTEWILHDLATACETFGIEYTEVSVLPTPAINYCFFQMGYDFAIDITASHNPYSDNGIKIFERGHTHGKKLTEKGCEYIEQSIETDLKYIPIATSLNNNLHNEALDLYKLHLKNYLGANISFNGLNIAIDCANGATSIIGDSIFKELGCTTTLIHANVNYGTGINKDCGSTHLESLQSTVTKNHCDFGIAYDGDGDRCLLVDNKGNIVDGDEIIAILANYLKLDQIAITVMANQGLLNWAKSHNIHTETTPVGDSNVAAAMITKNIEIGGEQSGHIILPNEPTGDGILTSLMLAKVVAETKESLSNLAHIIEKSPQVIVNLEATKEQKVSLKDKAEAKNLLLNYSKKLEPENGRLLVRPSGTEPLIRITMWGDNKETIESLANELKNKLGEIL